MALNIDIPAAILEREISHDATMEYIRRLDPKRHESTTPENVEMLIGLLKHCGFETIADLHEVVRIGWDKFLEYERQKHVSIYPLSGTLTVLLTVLISDPACRKKIATRREYTELEPYLRP